jgi:glucosamine--fructose-6-phosphate aminotransferase (isomerizing)
MQLARGNHTYNEIKSQGTVWAATLAAFDEQAGRVEALLRRPFAQTLFTGCGSTYYLSRAAASVWQSLTRRAARGVPASEIWLQSSSVLTAEETLLVTVSRSGETTETLRALEVFEAQGGEESLSITVYGDKELARRTGHSLVTRGAEEESVAQTRSFSSMYLLAQAAAGLAAGDSRHLESLRQAPDFFQPLIARYEELAHSLSRDMSLERFIFLGSGAQYGLACEAMLKMKEMSLSPSEAFHFLEFRHGPMSVVAPGTLIVGLLGDAAYEQEVRVLSEMQALGARVLALGENPTGLDADHVVSLGSGLPELPRSVLLLPVLQLLAFYRAYEKGLDPDRPTNLNAVVRL